MFGCAHHNIRYLFLCLSIAVIAFLVRWVALDERPFHNDEGVNHFFVEQTLEKGYYPYSHENYHGPLYFYFLTGAESLFGDSERAIRSVTVILGVLLCLLPLFFLKSDPMAVRMLMSLLLVSSCTLIYYSRYAIHETLFTLASLIFSLSVLEWWKTKSVRMGYLAFLGLFLLICTKETWIIVVACTGIAAGASSASCIVSRARMLLEQKQHIFFASILLVLGVVFVYTGGFRWSTGMREFFLAIPQWIGRNHSDTGHHKGFAYYAEIFEQTEPLLMLNPFTVLLEIFGIGLRKVYLEKSAGWETLLSWRHVSLWIATFCTLACLGILLWRSSMRKAWSFLSSDRGHNFRFLFIYGMAQGVVYSVLSYKTPWLIINISAPLLLVFAYVALALFPISGAISRERKVSATYFLNAIVVMGFIALQGFSTYTHAFAHSYGKDLAHEPEHPLAYVHTTPGMPELAQKILLYLDEHPKAKVLIGVSQYWPLPYYLRSRKGNLAYLSSEDFDRFSKDHDVLILDKKVDIQDPRFWRWEGRLSAVQETITYFRK